MHTPEPGREQFLEQLALSPSDCFKVMPAPSRVHTSSERNAGLPVVHIRMRPVLAHLGETEERRSVWCVDQKNIFVQSNKAISNRHSRVSPHRIYGAHLNRSASPKALDSFGLPFFSPQEESGQAGQTPSNEVPCGKVQSGLHRCASAISMSLRESPRHSKVQTTPDAASTNRASTNCRGEHFVFDFVHIESATQEEVFEESALYVIDKALLGQNVTIICYGPTGSGKTYSMMGSTLAQSSRKQKLTRLTKENKFFLEKSENALVADKGLGGVGYYVEFSQSSCRDSSVMDTGVASADLVATPLLDEGVVKNEQEEHCRKSLSPACVNDVVELTPYSASSCPSLFEVESPKSFSGGIRRDVGPLSSCGGRSVKGLYLEGAYRLGLLPRIVLILLERRGVHIVSNQGEALAKGCSIIPAANEKEKSTDKNKRSRTFFLTLQELVFYGVELYMDEFRDLLDPAKRPIANVGDSGGLDAFCQRMNICKASPTRGSAGEGGGNGRKLTENSGGGVPLTSVDDFYRCYQLASRNRVTKKHQCNDTSSRSHAMFILQLQFSLDSNELGTAASAQTFHSYIAMVDLAGSERVKKTKVEGHAFREAQYINKSLSALSAVLLALYQRSSHVPYRDSKLTRLLRPCLEAGHVLTLVHVPPCSPEETISSLKFAEQVRYTNVQKHDGLDTNSELVTLFQGIKDPEDAERIKTFHMMEEEHAQLCAELRLAYITCNVQDGSQNSFLTSSTDQVNCLLQCQDIQRIQQRGYIIKTLAGRGLSFLFDEEEERLLERTAEIERYWSAKIEDAKLKMNHEVETTRAAIEKIQSYNAKLAEENSRQVQRDAYASSLRQRLKELSTDHTKCARERLLLLEGLRAVRQRIAMQDDLERCMDDQLKEITTMNGVGDRNAITMLVNANDVEMREIYSQQLFLSKEMSLLRDESTCFVKGDGIWEGFWARLMRQEFLLILNIDIEMLESIVLHPKTIYWAFKKSGLPQDAKENIVSSFSSSHLVHTKKLLDAFETIKDHPTGTFYESDDFRPGEFHLPPIPLILSNGSEVKHAISLIGSYSDEAMLQEMSVKKLFLEGIFCEATCLSMSINELIARELSVDETVWRCGYGLQWGCLRLVHSPKDESSYCLEFVQRVYANTDQVWDRRIISIPLTEPQLCIRLHVIDTEGVFPMPALDEESTTTVEALKLPFIAMELRGVFQSVVNTAADMHEQPKAEEGTKMQYNRGRNESHYIDSDCTYNNNSDNNEFMFAAAENSVSGDVFLSKRLDCGGELLLPSSCMSSFEKGSCCILFHFPERVVATSTRTEAVECIVAALSALTLPLFPVTSESPLFKDDELDAVLGNISVAEYRHVPHVLLKAQDSLLCGDNIVNSSIFFTLGMPLLGYTSHMLVRFYFEKHTDNSVSAAGDADFHSQDTSNNSISAILVTTCRLFNQLRTITLSRGSGDSSSTSADNSRGCGNGGNSVTAKNIGGIVWGLDEADTILWKMYRLQAFRRIMRAKVRQQLIDAEDIKAELLYSCSESELMCGSYLNEVSKEARDLLDQQQSQSQNGSLSLLCGMFSASPSLCRELCGAAVPWSIWHWSHRWRALQETYNKKQNRTLGLAVFNDKNIDFGVIDDDDDADGIDSLQDCHFGACFMNGPSVAEKEIIVCDSVVFEDVPCYLEGMML